MTSDTIYYLDSTLQIGSDYVVFDGRDQYLLDDIEGVSTVFTRVYALITIGFYDHSERTFAPPDRATAMRILDALTRALGGVGSVPPAPKSQRLP